MADGLAGWLGTARGLQRWAPARSQQGDESQRGHAWMMPLSCAVSICQTCGSSAAAPLPTPASGAGSMLCTLSTTPMLAATAARGRRGAQVGECRAGCCAALTARSRGTQSADRGWRRVPPHLARCPCACPQTLA